MKIPQRLISTLALILIFLALLPATVHPQSPGEVVISEIAWMGTTTSFNDEGYLPFLVTVQ